jgi:hypothetical protein
MKIKDQEITINGDVYVLKESLSKKEPESGLQCVLIRAKYAGVHFGYLKTSEFTLSGKVVVLVSTRRVWYWDGAASLSQMALDGVSKPDKCKFSVQLETNEIVDVIETIPLTEKAKDNLYKVAVWKQ